MPCYKPLKAFYKLRPDGSGKKDIIFSNSKSDFIGSDSFGNLYGTPIDIPCGQCIGCRLEYSRQWAVRCVLESLQHEHNYFLTLTYDNSSLPLSNCFQVDSDGCLIEGSEFLSASLVPQHLTKFLKDLRRYFSYHFDHDNIRFYACGEYGSKTLRPHYHIILFNCPIPDLKFLKSSFNGDSYYTSDILSKVWKKGFVLVADCNYNSCSYVARYMLKKLKGDDSIFYEVNCLVPPFTRCSRDPGIAREYYDNFSDKIYRYDQIVITDSNGLAKKIKPPKYFDRLYDVDSPDDFLKIKESRSASADCSLKSKLSQTSLDKDTYLSMVNDLKVNSCKKLLRPVE